MYGMCSHVRGWILVCFLCHRKMDRLGLFHVSAIVLSNLYQVSVVGKAPLISWNQMSFTYQSSNGSIQHSQQVTECSKHLKKAGEYSCWKKKFNKSNIGNKKCLKESMCMQFLSLFSHLHSKSRWCSMFRPFKFCTVNANTRFNHQNCLFVWPAKKQRKEKKNNLNRKDFFKTWLMKTIIYK